MDKSLILKKLQEIISNKALDLENLIEETRTSNNETKSSMGDKYETGREMLQQEINNLQLQLNEVLKQRNFLKTIQTKDSTIAEKGAIVETDTTHFYISISLRELKWKGVNFICISPESPIAKALLGKKKNETFTFNNKTQKIKNIW